jgi:predicted peptidase
MRLLVRFLLLAILLVSLAVLGFRAFYDFNLIYQGDTLVVKKSSPDSYDYLLQIPRGYNDFSGPLPLLIFLHGAGETGTDPRTLLEHGPAQFAKIHFKKLETSYFPFIVVTPIWPEKRWEPKRVVTLLDQVLAENKYRFKIDSERIYLTGYSMGGFGTIETAMEFPERFAAIIPVAGGGEPSKAKKLQNVSCWFFHGEKDTTVPLPSSQLLVDEMRKLGHRDVSMQVMPQLGHDIASYVYVKPTIYSWLLLKRKNRFGQQETIDQKFMPNIKQ